MTSARASTTIKVPPETRDRLKAQASAHGQTLAQYLETLMARQERAERLARLKAQMRATPADLQHSWHQEAVAWEHGELQDMQDA